MPASVKPKTDSDYEDSVIHKLSEIPIALMNDSYVLSAAFLYSLGVTSADIGHYKTAIKINDKWEIYDDMKTKFEEVSPNKEAIIHALFYLKQ